MRSERPSKPRSSRTLPPSSPLQANTLRTNPIAVPGLSACRRTAVRRSRKHAGSGNLCVWRLLEDVPVRQRTT